MRLVSRIIAIAAVLGAMIGAMTACASDDTRAANAYKLVKPPARTTIENVSADGKSLTVRVEHDTCQSLSLDGVREDKTAVDVALLRTVPESTAPCTLALKITRIPVRLKAPLNGRDLRISSVRA